LAADINLHLYCTNDPVGATDPDGEKPTCEPEYQGDYQKDGSKIDVYDKVYKNRRNDPNSSLDYNNDAGQQGHAWITHIQYWAKPTIYSNGLTYVANAQLTFQNMGVTGTLLATITLNVDVACECIEEKGKAPRCEPHFPSASLDRTHKEKIRRAGDLGTPLQLIRAEKPQNGFTLGGPPEDGVVRSIWVPPGVTPPDPAQWANYTSEIFYVGLEMTAKGTVAGDVATVTVQTTFDGGMKTGGTVSRTQLNTYKWKCVLQEEQDKEGGNPPKIE
jgi:hypothetical protein